MSSRSAGPSGDPSVLVILAGGNSIETFDLKVAEETVCSKTELHQAQHHVE